MINLEKKKPLNLTKQAPGLNSIKIGLSWDASTQGNNADLDISVFMLNEFGKLPSDGFIVFYNNLVSEDGSVISKKDNRTGEGDGDDEEINISLSKVSSSIIQLMFIITIYNTDEGFHFGNVSNSSVRVYNQEDGKILCQYKLSDSHDGYDSVIVGRIYRLGSEWSFEALGQPFSDGITAAYSLYS